MKKRSRRYIAKRKNPLWWMEIMVQHAADRIEDMTRRSQPKLIPGSLYANISYSEPMMYHEGAAEIIKSSLDIVNNKTVPPFYTEQPKTL